MPLSAKEKREIAIAAHQAFMATGKKYKKELETVPPCRECGIVPRQYTRWNDDSVSCLNKRECYARQDELEKANR